MLRSPWGAVARGNAHIGVIQVLEERGIEIVTIAGSSIGALVRGLYSAGKLEAYTDWVTNLTQFDVLRLLDVSLSAPGVVRAEKIFARVRDLLDGALIEDLPVPFTAVATDLLPRRVVWFQRGPVATSVRGSSAMPGVFPPVMLNGRRLADGSVTDPVPGAPTASIQSDLTIAIDLGGVRTGSQERSPAHETAEENPLEEWADRFRHSASNLFDRDLVRSLLNHLGTRAGTNETRSGGEPLDALPAGLGRFDVMTQSLEAMQSVLTHIGGGPVNRGTVTQVAFDQPNLSPIRRRNACRHRTTRTRRRPRSQRRAASRR